MRRLIALVFVGVTMAATLRGQTPQASEIDWTDKAVRRQAVLETAYAYYLKSDCVQYGSIILVAHGGMGFCRRTK